MKKQVLFLVMLSCLCLQAAIGSGVEERSAIGGNENFNLVSNLAKVEFSFGE